MLELGPAEGYFSRHLKEEMHCTIDAVEIDPSMADAARVWCRTMIVGNLETLDLPSLLPASAYDVILMADVLEHLHDPAPLLQQLHSLLKPEGCCLISLPNVAYGGLIASLLGGEFEYRNEGLLDRTHLRFYTRSSLAQLFEHTAWFPHVWQPITLSLWESEFRTRLETLPSAIVDILASRPELSCYQWLIEVRAQAPLQTSESALPDQWPGERFPVRLFWTDDKHPFDYVRSQILWGKVGAPRKVEEFVLDDGVNATRLRLRPSDRPGFMRLYKVVLRDADQGTLWQWTIANGVAALASAVSGMQLSDAGEHALLLLNERESWLDLAWQGTANSHAHTVELTFGWPESADFVAAQAAFDATALLPLRTELDAVKTLMGTRDHELAVRNEHLRVIHAELGAVKALVGTRDHELAVRNEHLQHTRTELDAVKALIGTRDHELAVRDQHLQHTRTELDAVKALVGTRDHELAVRDQHLQHTRTELDAVKALVGTRDHELATRDGTIRAQQEKLQAQVAEISDLRQRLEEQTAQTTTLQAQIARMQTFSGWLKQPLHGLRKSIRKTENPF